MSAPWRARLRLWMGKIAVNMQEIFGGKSIVMLWILTVGLAAAFIQPTGVGLATVLAGTLIVVAIGLTLGADIWKRFGRARGGDVVPFGATDASDLERLDSDFG